MKKLYFLLAGLALATTATAQNFVYSPTTNLTVDLVTNEYNVSDIYMVTPDSTGITFQWDVLENTIPAGWDYSLCDYTSCHFSLPSTGTMTEITTSEMQSGTRGFLKFNVQPFEIYGQAIVRFYLYDSSNPQVGDTVEFIFNHQNTAGITNNQISDVQLFPNPVKEQFFVTKGAFEKVEVNIYSLQGQHVLNEVVTSEKQGVSTEDLAPGWYLVHVLSDGEVVKTDKVQIQ